MNCVSGQRSPSFFILDIYVCITGEKKAFLQHFWLQYLDWPHIKYVCNIWEPLSRHPAALMWRPGSRWLTKLTDFADLLLQCCLLKSCDQYLFWNLASSENNTRQSNNLGNERPLSPWLVNFKCSGLGRGANTTCSLLLCVQGEGTSLIQSCTIKVFYIW